MTTPEKRWQLLLVADNGRIIPFKHIKGIALSLLISLVLMGLVCAGLGWQLSQEKIRHRQTRNQLALAQQEAARYKSENEIVTTELILAEARMGKAGLPVPQRHARNSPSETQQADVETLPTAKQTPGGQTQKIPAAEKQSLSTQANESSLKPSKSAIPQVADLDPLLKKKPLSAEPPAVALGDMNLQHNPSSGRVTATFRVSNTGPRSSPVEGWCLVALKSDPVDANTWIGLPDGTLVDGKLDPKKGKNFKISRFVDVDMDAAVVNEASSFTTATVYIFDETGDVLVEKDYPISLKLVPSGADASVGGDEEELGVALSSFEIQQDASSYSLRATFRVSNTGPRSLPVAGRCVVVLKNDQMSPDAWLALPAGAIMNGKPRKEQGQAFKISRFKTIDIETTVKTDPSVFNSAVVYVFDMDGTLLLEKAYPIRLAAPVSRPGAAMVPETADTPKADDAAAQPAGDPASGKSPAPTKAEEGRARF